MGAHNSYIYIITIQTINARSTKVDLNSHNISPGSNIFPFDSSDQILRADCQVLGLPEIRWLMILISLPARQMPFHFFLQHGSYPSCPLNCSLNRSKLISPDDKIIPFWTGSGLSDLIHRLHVLGIIFPTGSNKLIRYYIHMGEPLAGFTVYCTFQFISCTGPNFNYSQGKQYSTNIT